MKFRNLLLPFILLFSLLLPISVQNANAGLACVYVKKQGKAVFDGKWTEQQANEPLTELSKRMDKAMSIVFKNQGCFTKSEITKTKKAIRDIQKQCVDAKKDTSTWLFMKDICGAMSVLYKYAK